VTNNNSNFNLVPLCFMLTAEHDGRPGCTLDNLYYEPLDITLLLVLRYLIVIIMIRFKYIQGMCQLKYKNL
jgi:hypothetical protein